MGRPTPTTASAPAASFRGFARAEARACAAAAALVFLVALVASAAASAQPALDERLLALAPERIGERDVVEVLAHYRAPRMMLFSGSVPIVTMAPIAEFFVAMGYPRGEIADPRDGSIWYSSFADSEALAGLVAAHYERDGMRPMLIGHSQGGMMVVRVLHELAGDFHARIAVRDPASGEALAREAIADPLTGHERPVVGLSVSFAAAIATGKLMRVLLGQWDMLSRLRAIPDTVDEFAGYSIPGDVFEGTLDPQPYRPMGGAVVRNVTLSADVRHVDAPRVDALARDPTARAWIDTYAPGAAPPPLHGDQAANALLAADLWYEVKKHWCKEAQRLVRARISAGAR